MDLFYFWEELAPPRKKVIDRSHLCKCKKLRYLGKKTLRLFDRVHKDSKWQKLFSRGHYNDYWFIYLWGSSWKLFLCSRAGGEKGGREGLDLWGELCTHSSQILAFHLTSGGRDKSPQPRPNIDIPAWLFYCRTHRGLYLELYRGPNLDLADYFELFAFPLLDGFSSERKRCLSF